MDMLNEALRLIRVFHDLSQTELAARLGVSKSHVSEIESSKKTPSIEILQRYSKEFAIPISSIMFFAENLDEKPPVERVRVAVSSKVLRILKFIAERTERRAAEK
jgi:transcriptional regulator with XRE-family HTH domain